MKKFGGLGKKKQCCELRKCNRPLSPTNEKSMPTKESVREKSTQDNANNKLSKHKLEGSCTIPSKRSKISNVGLPSLPLTTDLKVLCGKIVAIMT